LKFALNLVGGLVNGNLKCLVLPGYKVIVYANICMHIYANTHCETRGGDVISTKHVDKVLRNDGKHQKASINFLTFTPLKSFCLCRLKLTRAPAPPGSNGSTDNCRKQKPAVSSAMNAEFVADAVFHGVVYKCGVETNRWVDLSRGFAKLTIGRDQTSNGVAIMVAQEGEKEVGNSRKIDLFAQQLGL
jgi:hypothetical protein